MSKTLSHRGFTGTAEVSLEDDCLIGRVLHIRDIIVYEGNTIDEIRLAFEAAVDDYMAHCAETGKSPDKPLSGSFNVRIGSELHRELVDKAFDFGLNLNEGVCRAVREWVKPRAPSQQNLILTIKPSGLSEDPPTRFVYSTSGESTANPVAKLIHSFGVSGNVTKHH